MHNYAKGAHGGHLIRGSLSIRLHGMTATELGLEAQAENKKQSTFQGKGTKKSMAYKSGVR